MAKVIALCNQKGGVTKSTSSINLGVGLALQGKKVLIADCDPQSDCTTALGWPDNDSLSVTLATLMEKVINDEPINPQEGILHHAEGVDLVPANMELSGMEVALVGAMSREFTLKSYIDTVKGAYDFVLIDCMPSLGMLTINALAAADSLIIPVQAQYLPAKGMTQLLKIVNKVRKQINPSLEISGILMTLVDARTNLAKATEETLRQQYGSHLRIYDPKIPISVKAAEASAAGMSIFAYDGSGKVAEAYMELARTVIADA
ncbi:MAG: AAA family ATPase [Defluviitaleaceae bacterium]|nr:AAA family ATPase [Defluviitaleaceae bacterium]